MQQSPIIDWHQSHNARLVEFAGWNMPLQYTSIVEEHHAVRRRAGLFDVSHMGRIRFEGIAAGAFLDSLLTCNTAAMHAGRIRYALICRDDGGILDDVLVCHNPDHWQLVVNAANHVTILDWLHRHAEDRDVRIIDETCQTAMFALQGPLSTRILSACDPAFPATLARYTGATCPSARFGPVIISRTGYTGEDGYELIAAAEHAVPLWNALMDVGEDHGLVAAGLGCRNTLRLEAGMPLYGSELTDQIDPLSAGLEFAVQLDAAEFIGKDNLLSIQRKPRPRRRIGLVLEGRRIARDQCPVIYEGREVGFVTSGTFSPTLEKSVAMAMVDRELTSPGQHLQVSLRNTLIPAQVTALPFYRR